MANVRVTFSADDQATEIARRLLEVLRTLDRQQRQNASSTTALARASQDVATRFQQMQGALVGIAAAVGATRLLGFARDVVNSADALQELSQRTGVSVESLSVLTQEAAKAGATTETVATAFRNLSRSVQQLQAGNQDAVESFRAIGLSAADIAGLRLDQVLVRIANAMARFEDGSGKAAVATRLFGRAGDELLPLLNQLANGGFDRAREEAERLGSVIGTDAAQAADEFNDSLSRVQQSLRGVITELSGALAPLADLLDRVANFFGALPGPLKQFIAGAAVAGAVALVVAGAVGILAIALGGLAAAIGATGGTAIAAIIGGIAGLGAAAATADGLVKKLGGSLSALDKDPVLEQLAKSGAFGTRGTITLQDPAQLKALRQARLAEVRAQARDEQREVEAELRKTTVIEEARFAQGITSLREFFQARAEIVKQGTAAEETALRSELTALRAAPLAEDTEAARVTRAREIATLESQIRSTRVQGETQLLTLVEQERVARRSAFEEAQSFQSQVFRLQGEELRATQIEIEQSATRFAEVLRTLGVDSELVTELRSAFSTILTDRAAFVEQERVSTRELNELTLDRQRIEQAISEGKISERDGTLAIAEAERQRIPALQQAADLMRAFAERVGDPALLLAAQQLEQQIAGMGRAASESARLAANFRDNLLSAAQSGFANFLGSTINQVRTLGEAFRELFGSILGSFQQIAADILASQIFERIGGLFGRGGDNAGATALAAAGVTVSTGATAVSGAATALGTAGGTLVTGANALTGAAGAISASAAALAAAAAALQSAQIIAAVDAGLKSIPSVFAKGGPVRGPGSGTSDSIPARLSAGEYVQPARTVAYYGQTFMEAVRKRLIPREVLRGLVGSGRAALGFGVRDGAQRLELLGREERPERVSGGPQLDPLRVTPWGAILRVGGVEQVLLLALQHAHHQGRDLLQYVRERTETGGAGNKFSGFSIGRDAQLTGLRFELPSGHAQQRTDRFSSLRSLTHSITSLFRRQDRVERSPEREQPAHRRRGEVVQGVIDVGLLGERVNRLHMLTRDLPRIISGERGVGESDKSSRALGLIHILGKHEGHPAVLVDVNRVTEAVAHPSPRPLLPTQGGHDTSVVHRSLALIRGVVNNVFGREQAREDVGDSVQPVGLAAPDVAVRVVMHHGIIDKLHVLRSQLIERVGQLSESVRLFRTERVLEKSSATVLTDRSREQRERVTDELRERDRERLRFVGHPTLSLGSLQYSVRRIVETVRHLLRPLAFAPLALAAGGVVRGPGSATSDSIPARLSAGEYVQPARSTTYYGLKVMEAIRHRLIPRDALQELVLSMPTVAVHTPQIRSLDAAGIPDLRFAEGGLVPAATGATTPVTLSRDDTLHAVLDVSPDLILRELESTRGVRAQTRIMQKNAAMFRAALGIRG